ncbi:DUF2490 domain-containing protein [Muricauda sp. 334s03]|uniref:DUF2490 domain-containing protein n=1 Tax=Flagellimonas yonaguniensis TaxID=3031325 RepID=A0ABT5Y013_9FLAO|nr:DUF2490 domain-containing protein [[Muricauda] yonaguniensis]MDF0716778.1 DUF2490 domain-containing protein [[Muricauda] yonaguniensis]
MEFTKYCSGLLCSIVLTILLAQPGHAQNSEENEYGSWLVLCGNAKIHEDWSIPAVGIIRHHHMLDKYGFFFFRTGASYKISKASTFTGGFALLNSNSYLEPNDVVNTNQLWLYGEYTLKSKFNDNSLAHRVRFENRRLINTEDPKVNNRIRYRLQYVRPIYKDVYFKAFDELFLNLEGNTYGQNRIFVGVGREITPNLKADIGYFNRRFKNYNEDMIRLSLSFNIDLTKNDLALQTDK